MCVCVCMYLNHFGVHLKLTQHYKLTILQFLKKAMKSKHTVNLWVNGYKHQVRKTATVMVMNWRCRS